MTPTQLVMLYRAKLNSGYDILNIYETGGYGRFGIWGNNGNGHGLTGHWSIPFKEALELHKRGELQEKLETELAIAKVLGYT